MGIREIIEQELKKQAKAEGLAEGKAEGSLETLTKVAKSLQLKGFSAEQIAGFLEVEPAFIEEILGELTE